MVCCDARDAPGPGLSTDVMRARGRAHHQRKDSQHGQEVDEAAEPQTPEAQEQAPAQAKAETLRD